MSKANKEYKSATAEGIPNLGEKVFRMQTREGHKRTMTVQVAPVTKPLVSTVRLNETGNDVNLTAVEPHIYNKKTKERTKLRRVGRSYVLDLWVWIGTSKAQRDKPDQKGKAAQTQRMDVDSDFTRPR